MMEENNSKHPIEKVEKVQGESNEVENKKFKTNENENGQEAEEEEEDSFCNPMVSDSDEEIEKDVNSWGDRIGKTIYSERHVLKILLHWTEEIKKAVEESTVGDADKDDENVEPTSDINVVYEELSFLWDMSAETDVMNYLVDKNIFELIKATIESANQSRLLEIALGIFANLLSSLEILEKFSKTIDPELRLIELILNSIENYSSVPILLQIFAILNRVTWSLRNVQPLEDWLTILLEAKFIESTNFLLKSSRNPTLLSEVITTMFNLIELLSPEIGPEGSTSTTEVWENYKTFCDDTNFISSLCEGIIELFKQSKSRNLGADVNELEAESNRNTVLYQIRNGIKDGVKAFSCFKLCKNGQNSIIAKSNEIIDVLNTLYNSWHIIDYKYFKEMKEKELVDFFISALELSTFLLSQIDSNKLNKTHLIEPTKPYLRIMKTRGRDKDHQEKKKNVSPYILNLISKMKNYYDDLESKFKSQTQVFTDNDFRKSKIFVEHLKLL